MFCGQKVRHFTWNYFQWRSPSFLRLKQSCDYWYLLISTSRMIISVLYGSQKKREFISLYDINTLNAELNPICHLLALLGDHHILHVSIIRVKCNLLALLVAHHIPHISRLRVNRVLYQAIRRNYEKWLLPPSCIVVWLSTWTGSASTGQILMIFDYVFRKYVEKIQTFLR